MALSIKLIIPNPFTNPFPSDVPVIAYQNNQELLVMINMQGSTVPFHAYSKPR